MNNQVLSIEQMQELKELGIDVSNASMYYVIDDGEILDLAVLSCSIEHIRDINKNNGLTYIPTFTLQDILNIISNIKEYVWILNESGMILENLKGIEFHREHHGNLIQAAFNMLKWCKQNNYL